MLSALDNFPLGRRGDRPLRLPMDRATALRVADSVPGVQVVSGGLAFAWDAVPALGAILPINEGQLPATPTGLNLTGLVEYEEHFKSRLRPYQRDMVGFLAARSYAINADPMRCLSGDTPIKVRRGTKSIELTMSELAAGLLGRRNWDLSLPTYAQSMDEEGSVKLNRITLLHRTGRKFCLKLVLSNGMELVATPEHRIATPDGMKRLEELAPGDWVLVSEPPESKGYRTRQHSTYRYGLWSHPYAEKLTVNRKDRPNEEVARVKRHRLSAEAKVNGLGLEEFCERVRDGDVKGLKFLDPQQWHIHHLDGDHANDSQDNLVPMSHSEHARHHGEEENWRFVAHRAMPVFVKRIVPAGERETFDLTVENPHNNYVASGIIVSNSGKTPTTLAAAALVGSKKTLIVCPSIAKLVWATEIAKWMHLPSTILYGRGGDEARTFCVQCNGTGRTGGEHCHDCKAANGQSYGAVIHRDDGVGAALERARFTICNYDVLIPQVEKDAAGVRSERGDLPGWTEKLKDFDLVIADEAHILRGRSKRDRAGESRRDKLIQLSKGVPRFWALSGTPVYGRVADLWALLDVVTDGLYGRPFFRYDVRYCLPAGAQVWMGDLTHKPIESLTVGDTVWGWTQTGRGQHRKLTKATVLDTFVREAEVIEATLASGRTVRSTRNHLWASPVSKSVPYRTLSLGAETKRKGREGAKSRRSTLGFVLDPTLPVGATTSHDYLRGYAHGLADGDGTVGMRWHLRPKRNGTCAELVRRVQVRLDISNVEALDRFEFALRQSNVAYSRTAHKKFPGITATGTQALDFFYQPRNGGDDYWRGWLAGMYDAEGWGCVFAQHIKVNSETHANLRDALARFGFEVAHDDESVRIVGNGKGDKGARTREFIRFWLLIQPAIQRKAEPMMDAALYWEHDPVTAIKSLGVQKVYDIKTTTQNFIVDGYGSHNCNGQKGQYGWENDGATNVEELKSRLDTFMLKRDRKEILPHLPPKTRQVVRIDAGKAEFKKPRGKKGAGGLHGALRVTAKLKEPKVAEAVLDECAEGAKVVVFAYLRENAENLAKAIAKGCEDDVRVRARNPRVWCVSGDTPVDARFKQAQTFREWTGCGIFVATIDSVPVAISLKGAQSVHFADLTFDPASLLQAEDRPYEVGTSGLTIVYYMVEKTVDEHVVGLVLPKMETLESMVKERAAGDFRAAFGGVSDPDAMAEEIWARMEAAAL